MTQKSSKRQIIAAIRARSKEGSASWPDPVGDARFLLAEVDRLRDALYECAVVSGADVSDGPPTWPDVDVWALAEVRQLREDYDNALDEIPPAAKAGS